MDSGTRSTLIRQLRGQEAWIPNLHAALGPCGDVSKYLSQLQTSASEYLDDMEPDSVRRAGLRKADFGLFVASWWPLGELEQLKKLLLFCIWLFLWDDEIDESKGTLTNDFDKSQQYRKDTEHFVEHSIGLRHHSFDHILQQRITDFAPFGEALRTTYTTEQKHAFMEEIVFFMDQSMEEQRRRINDELPTNKQYWACRLGTSAVYLTCAALEYGYCLKLPARVVRSEQLRALWKETNYIVSITNDIMSLKKELDNDGLDNIVPILYLATGSVQAAIDRAATDLATAAQRFNVAAIRLLHDTGTDEKSKEATWHMIRGCRDNCLGNLHWSLITARYGMNTAAIDSYGRRHVLL